MFGVATMPIAGARGSRKHRMAPSDRLALADLGRVATLSIDTDEETVINSRQAVSASSALVPR